MNPYKQTDYPELVKAYLALPASAGKRKIRKAKASLPLKEWAATVRANQARGRQRHAEHAGAKG